MDLSCPGADCDTFSNKEWVEEWHKSFEKNLVFILEDDRLQQFWREVVDFSAVKKYLCKFIHQRRMWCTFCLEPCDAGEKMCSVCLDSIISGLPVVLACGRI